MIEWLYPITEIWAKSFLLFNTKTLTNININHSKNEKTIQRIDNRRKHYEFR